MFKKATTPSPMGIFPGYGVNTARLNGADFEPVPIRPVQHQNWPEMNVQLFNGWSKITTNKYVYDNWLRLLSNRDSGFTKQVLPSGAPNRGPSPYNVQNFFNRTAGMQPTNPGGPGFILPGIAGNFEPGV